MAKTTSIMRISGTIGDVTYYRRGGKSFARKKTSLTADRVKSDPRFAASQIRAKEYGAAATISRHLREGLGPLQHFMQTGKQHARLVQLLLPGFERTRNQKAPAPFSASRAENALRTLRFSASTQPCSLSAAEPAITHATQRGQRRITVTPPVFDRLPFKAPSGATHLAFILHVQPISDYTFDHRTKKYSPVANKAATITHTHRFGWQQVSRQDATQHPPQEIILGKSQEGITYLIWWGIIFAQQVGSSMEALRLGGALQLAEMVPMTQKPIRQTPRFHSQAETDPLTALEAILGIPITRISPHSDYPPS